VEEYNIPELLMQCCVALALLEGVAVPNPSCCCCTVQTLNPFGRSNQTFRYWEEDELKDLVAAVGLTDYTRTRSRMFIMFAATKPAAERQPEQW
jgi:hypothetical protein